MLMIQFLRGYFPAVCGEDMDFKDSVLLNGSQLL